MADTNDIIGGYKLRNLMQTGQVSQVFEVVEPASNRHFAMKLLLPEHAKTAEHRRALFHEVSIGMKMRHENVINILKVNKSETSPHFIMEYFPSGSIRTRLMSKDERDKEFLKNNAKKIFQTDRNRLSLHEYVRLRALRRESRQYPCQRSRSNEDHRLCHLEAD